jgi:hypothetical protein
MYKEYLQVKANFTSSQFVIEEICLEKCLNVFLMWAIQKILRIFFVSSTKFLDILLIGPNCNTHVLNEVLLKMNSSFINH